MKLVTKEEDRFLWLLKRIIHISLKILGILMVVVIISGVVDVAWTIYLRFAAEPRFILTMGDILATFGAFMVVLIAIEIFQNIILYLRDDVIHVKIVLATALMAIARKVIILDYDELEPMYILATGVVLLATGITYYVVYKLPDKEQIESAENTEESF
ncbi:phosphate-starvation-inducible PsiE family protein [Desulfosediminicola flagellatus]|uniref:phosphate-starvation-inducible PsiE family protein n=1 Tax=Desulfosediminicola flagellatus TaxID=2569541 RepID=UPI0010ABCDE4|nr:phosphate-starvation-inducible PsiE family protein [Desulfosediminicola flagellatus]